MEIYVNGRPIILTQKNFVAQGGEGKIFQKGGIAYKIYEELSKMIAPAKINELNIPDPNIIRPLDLILNKKKQKIGFTMQWLGDSNIPLCKLFTTKFQKDNNVNNDMIIELVENIKKTTYNIHSHNCLIVDGNELNYLVKPDFTTPLFIDVNSWKTPSYPPTAIMPSIRDWTVDTFNQLTDWFSFAIVTFQLFIGIHPFKGKHKSYRTNDFINRVRDRVSVFNSQVSLPPTTRDFNLIPSQYKDWYYKIFENGDRLPPPQTPGQIGTVMQVIVNLVKSTGSFEVMLVQEFNEEILFHNPQYQFTKTVDKIYLGKTDYRVSRGVELLFTPLEQIPILVKLENGVVKFKTLKTGYDFKGAELACTDMTIINNTLYLKNREKLIEMSFLVLGTNILSSVKTTWAIEPLSSQIFSNVIYQSVLGKAFLCIPIPSPDKKSQFQIKAIPELNDKIIEAKYENQVCMVITHNGKEYQKLILIFSPDFSTYTCRIVTGIDYVPINFTVLDNGVCIMITEDNAVEIFLNRIDKPNIKRIEDSDINNTMRLFKDGTIVKFFKDKIIYSIKMK